MSKRQRKQLKKIDDLIKDFEKHYKHFPREGLKKTIHELQDERVKITSSIGKNHGHGTPS